MSTKNYTTPKGARAWFAEPWRRTKVFPLLLIGIGAGAALPAIVGLILAGTGTIELEHSGLAAGIIMATIISAAVFTPVFEEVIFRYLFFRGLEKFFGSWAALAITGFLFGAAHLMFSKPEGTLEGALIVLAGTLAGVFFAAAYILTRSLWLPIGLHAGWNLITNVLMGPNIQDANRLMWVSPQGPTVSSGGNFGSDASILTSLVLAVAIVWLLRRAKQKGMLI